ncbi:uncharacterized protein LOC110977522 isoform X2 [Acanthaster planci]|uniref:Uncharacterized protein LOC110977522 isoform X2 n=1 Tax=Acanthaster planci TaxID=133434 RepID=A0A8B7Y542_ACAPL|nr:uncharacterized protein LOC110977522 isoform X2 [Acanthaster planci]
MLLTVNKKSSLFDVLMKRGRGCEGRPLNHGSSAKSFLGPDQRIKCLLENEDEDSSLISSCSELLCKLDVEHPVGRVAVEACLAHHKSHGTGTTTMITLAGLWATEGVPAPAIIQHGDECLEQCLSTLEAIATHNSELSGSETFFGADPHANTSCKRSARTDQLNTGKPHSSHPVKPDLRINSCSALGISTEALDSFPTYISTNHDDPDQQFIQVQFSKQQYDYSENFNSGAKLATAGPPGKLELDVKADDDVSWFFEGTSQSREYSLEYHKADCEDIIEALDRQFTRDKLHSTFLRKASSPSCQISEEVTSKGSNSGQVWGDIGSEFDPSFPVEELDACSTFPLEKVSGKPAQHDSDDDFDLCLPIEEVAFHHGSPAETSTGKPPQADSDDDFDSCFAAEKMTSSWKCSGEKFKNGKLLDEKLDVSFQKSSEILQIPASNQEINSGLSCNGADVKSQAPSTQSKCPSAISEAIQTLVQSKQQKMLSEQLSNVQNISRHFRSVETVIKQHNGHEQSSERGGQSELKYDTFPSQLSAEDATNFNQGSILLATSKKCDLPGSALAKPHQENAPEIRETLGNLVEVRTNETAAMRLLRVQTNSRHFRTVETACAQDVLHETDLTSGQVLNPQIASTEPEDNDEPEKISKFRSDCLEARLSHVASKTDRNTPTSTQDVHEASEQLVPNIVQLGLGLSHGSELEMRLVVQALRALSGNRSEDDSTRMPDLKRINVCTIAGPPVSDSHLQDGLLLPVDHHQRPIIAKTEGRHLKALLINGDAKPSFKHAGYKNKVKMTTVNTWTGRPSTDEKEWLSQIVRLIQELDVELLILKGLADEHLVHHCLSKKILLLQGVSYKTLLALEEACSAPVLTYLTDATLDDTACGITVECWESGWVGRTRVKDPDLKRKMFVRICVDGKILQTVVLCNPVGNLLPASEARFWASTHRLQATVADGCFLPGAGLPEQIAIKQLLQLNANDSVTSVSNHDNLSCWKSTIVSAFVDGFVHYLIQVLKNMGKLEDLSLAKAMIMNAVERDQLEPVLSSSFQSELQLNPCKVVTTGIRLLESKAEQTDCSQLRPDQTDNDPLCKSDSFKDGQKQANESHLKISSNLNSRTDSAAPNGKENYSCRQTTPASFAVYDGFSTKKSAWESAWALLKTVMRIDANIVTGVQELDQSASAIKLGKSVIL